MLSQTEMVKAALGSMYIGVCDVYEKTQTSGTHHEQVFTESKVLSAIPCRLSHSSSPKAQNGDVVETDQDIKLFYAPTYTIKPGSKITVTQNGITKSYIHSGKEAVYASHKEISLESIDRWV